MGGSTSSSKVTKANINDSYDKAKTEVNNMKSNYGNGVSTLIIVYNGTKTDLKLIQYQSKHGHWSDDNPGVSTIPAGKYAAMLHVHTSGAATGSQAYMVYAQPNKNYKPDGDDAKDDSSNTVYLQRFCCAWDTPYSGTNSFGIDTCSPGTAIENPEALEDKYSDKSAVATVDRDGLLPASGKFANYDSSPTLYFTLGTTLTQK